MKNKELTEIQTTFRQKAIVDMVKAGLSYQEIAEIFHISKARIQQLYTAIVKDGDDKGRKD